ncbi:thioredoxin domain-containing protein [Asticcacaulis sp. EMRT-3]|uniref:thioredoxin domain-containing protein n=1 Tax=Asticcacaulis sp. EMRT-3 TaxID=3040349 RepID=UPI0024AF3AB8|nr:thioredoxin domain-containing protein [Asticcacaulis sp. EMRT-3]MDI7774059.1 thioredoxin domain-containing protein [Asticcacaulis sp. EMRT-3]
MILSKLQSSGAGKPGFFAGLAAKILLVGAIASLGLMTACAKKADPTAGEMTMGNPNAKVTLVEYASVACPICAQVNATVIPEVRAKYIDTGKVLYVYKPMMTGNPSVATAGHLLAQCAGKDKYFDVIDAIMRSQKEMGGEETGYSNARPVLWGIAQSVGMTQAQFNACITDKKAIDTLKQKMDTYMRVDKVDATPTFFVNGKRMTMVKGDISDFDNAIQPLLK